MTTYVANAFSLQMVPRQLLGDVRFEAIEAPSAETLAAATSCVGHVDTAAVLGVPMNRINVTLNQGDTVLVGQLVGGRLPEGATTLPEGFQIAWIKVTL